MVTIIAEKIRVEEMHRRPNAVAITDEIFADMEWDIVWSQRVENALAAALAEARRVLTSTPTGKE